MSQVSTSSILSTLVTTSISYFNTVWIYFSTHWWLGLLFIVYHTLIWHHKTAVDQTNVYFNARQKQPRTLIGIARRTLKWHKIKKWF